MENPVLRGRVRSELSKKVWRKRKSEGGKGRCAYCGRIIYAGGVVIGGRPYHKSCAELAMAGVKKAELIKNPRKKVPITSVLLGRYMGHPPKPYFAGLERGLAVLKEKEFKEWSDAVKYAERLASETGLPIKRLGLAFPSLNPKKESKLLGTIYIHKESGAFMRGHGPPPPGFKYASSEEIRRLQKSGILPPFHNPLPDKQRRVPRDAYRYFGAVPLNPVPAPWHPRYRTYLRASIKAWVGYNLPPGAISPRHYVGSLRQHIAPQTLTARRLKEALSEDFHTNVPLATAEKLLDVYPEIKWKESKENPRYIYGPTGFRPPARWFAKMAQRGAASYFGKKVKDLTKAEHAKLGRIIGGIFAQYSPRTRLEILKKYE